MAVALLVHVVLLADAKNSKQHSAMQWAEPTRATVQRAQAILAAAVADALLAKSKIATAIAVLKHG